MSRLFLSALDGLRRGALELALPDGSTRRFEGPEPGPEVRIEVRDDRFFRRMLFDGEIGAGESYIRGEWRADSLVGAVELGILNRGRLRRGNPLFWIGAAGGWLAHRLRRNTRRGARRNIADHYDLGNEFFALFLDDSMTYSSALFERDDQSLAAAQRAKYARIADRAGLEPGHRVLEIGCGWGGFASYAAAERGCRVTGLTISPAQAAYARRRIAGAGLADRVTIELKDYREPAGSFDRVVSIEMLEAVGHAYLPDYFEAIDRALAPGGAAAIQVITIPDERYLRYRLRPDYIQRFIFPGAHLPSVGAMTRAMERGTRLRIEGAEDIAPSYARTLAAWRARFLARADDVRELGFDDAFIRRWEYYFAYCEAAFRTRYVSDLQLVVRRAGEAPVVAVAVVLVVMAAVMAGLWLVSLRRHEADVVDLGWTAGLGASALFYAAVIPAGLPARRWLVAAMAAGWAGRLALHLYRRVVEPGEDGRYRELRARWGPAARSRFFVFFQAQGVLVALLSVHFLLAMVASPAPLGVRDLAATLVWAVAIGGEALADRQLAAFRADPANAGRVCRRGLWGASRHPNYFFEWVHWLAYIPFAWGTGWLPVMAIAPALILVTILFVTGIPPTEAQALRSRGEAYREYRRTTSAFVPWFPKRGDG